MSPSEISRRRFLSVSSSAVAALGLAAGRGEAVSGANDRIGIGWIGCGGRGSALAGEIAALAAKRNVEIRAVCDVWKVNLDAAAGRVEKWFGKAPKKSTRFGELLALDGIDAVIIATPDYAHTPILIAALEAGKDAYVEKPMSVEIPLANRALDLAREKSRVVQVGTQRRSEGKFPAARRELATGILGHISRVTAGVHFNHARWARGYADCREQDVDWGAFLFNRKMRPFDPRLLRRWHFYRDFTNGLSGLWMSHYVDLVHLLTGARHPGWAVTGGDTYVWKDGREHCDVFHALLGYPEGFLFDWAMSLTNASPGHFTIHGTQGTLDVDAMTISPAGGAPGTKVKEMRIAADPNRSHMDNWLDCLRSRERPAADIEYGHQHAVATILAAAALHQGRRMRYDPERREMVAG